MRPAIVLSVALAVAATQASAQGRNSSTVSGLVERGKNAVNDLRYGEAATIARQILAYGDQLSRQQRLDGLELLTAAVYPEGGTTQRADSAKFLIRRLTALGITRGLARALSWRGQDSLFAVVAGDPSPSLTATQRAVLDGDSRLRDSIPDIVALVQGRMPAEEIVRRVRLDCYAVSFDSLGTALRGLQASPALTEALRGTCSRLFVTTGSASSVTFAGHNLGAAPDTGRSWPVDPGTRVQLRAAGSRRTDSTTLDVPPGRLVRVRFEAPADTMPWPLQRDPVQIAEGLRLFDRWTPSSSRPAPPKKPSAGASRSRSFWFTLVGGAGGFALGQLVPAVGCNDNQTVPPGELWSVDGKFRGPGESVNLGKGAACTIGIAAGTAVASLLVSRIGRRSDAGAMARYTRESAEYQTSLKNWEQRERRAHAERQPAVRAAMDEDRKNIAEVQARNDMTAGRNRQLAQGPQITVTELGPDVFVSRSRTEATVSDVDARVPRAPRSNATAAAIVIGNQEYEKAVDAGSSDFAIRDAKSARRYLVEEFGYAPERVMLDTNITTARLTELLGNETNEATSQVAELLATSPPNTVDVVVFFSGRARWDESSRRRVILPVDADPARLSATSLSLEQLCRNLSALSPRSATVIVDAGFGADAAPAPGQCLGPQGPKVDVLYAVTGDQRANAAADQGHGLFTYFVLKGFQGAADANNDRRVTFGELSDYVRSNVDSYAQDRLRGARQVPDAVTSNRARIVVTLP